MKKIPNNIKSGLIVGLTFFVTIICGGFVYAAVSHVSSGSSLTSSQFNQVIDTIVPANSIAIFNGSACPIGWSAADGTNSTPDLRGEFIRGLDNGRGLDSGRVLGSSQLGTKIPRFFIGYSTPTIGRADQPTNSWNEVADVESIVAVNNSYRRVNTNSYTSTCCNGTQTSAIRLRPRNVALLYCIKN